MKSPYLWPEFTLVIRVAVILPFTTLMHYT